MVPGPPPVGAGEPGRKGRLRPHEVAEAAVLADVAVALCLLGWLLPLGGVFTILSIVPMAVLGARHRARAVIAGGVAGAVTSLLLGGTGLAGNLASTAVVGIIVGAGIRRSWGRGRTVAVAVFGVWPLVAGLAIGMLALFTGLRRLALAQVLVQWRGASRALQHFGFGSLASVGDQVVPWIVTHWPIPLAAGILVGLAGAVWLTHRISLPVVRHLGRVVPPGPPIPLGGGATPTAPPTTSARTPATPGPVPVRLRSVGFRYPGARRDAFRSVTAEVRPGELVAVVGPNGSGKSTLVRLLAGAAPTAGTVLRPGSPALGQAGGTAIVAQHPERQVLGVRARDDVVWGLPGGVDIDIEGLLDRVGLAGYGNRETTTLSGGELQRLALAAALARRPALLLSDESTAMIDPEGRHQVMDLLARAAAGGTAVVHVTHRPEEAARADRVLAMGGELPSPTVHRGRRAGTEGTLRLRGVGHLYGRGTPWVHRALEGVDLDVGPGDGVLVVGRNGSGKSTLAWIMAGLLTPSEGAAWLDGMPLDQAVGRVGLAFQHARLQLLRSVVRDDIRAAAGVDRQRADAALALVGLDPAQVADRRVDELSGGQQRRAALAGVLAARPPILVLDEPFAGMDAAGRAELVEVLARLRAETGTALLVVSHDPEGADRLANRIVRLDRGQVVAEEATSGAVARSGGLGTAPAPRAWSGGGSSERRPTVVAPLRGLSGSGNASGNASGSGSPNGSGNGAGNGNGGAVVAGNGARNAGSSRNDRPRRRRQREVLLFRPLPRETPLHHLWAGTKLFGLLAVALTLSFLAGWWAIGVMAALLAVGFALARVPLGARPRLPAWFWIGILLTAVLPLLAGGAPVVHVGNLAVGLGGLARWARLMALAFVVLLAAALVSWTTPLGGVAPALSRLAAPARRLGVPADEWAVAVGLGLRCVPLLLDEVRILGAVTRLRAAHHRSRDRWSGWAVLPGNLLMAALVVGLRRAREMGTAIEARGGLWEGRTGRLRRIADDDRRPGWRDAVALAVVAGAVLVAVIG